MLQGVRTADFNVFDRELSLEWQALVTTFREQNAHAKDATRNLINTSFRKLRSAEGAFELLQNFKSIQSQGAIKEQMESKLQDILEQFSREIDSVASIFDSQRCALPVPTCQTALRFQIARCALQHVRKWPHHVQLCVYAAMLLTSSLC